MFDLFGKPNKKERNRERLERNVRQGKAGEDEVRTKYAMQGYEVERKHKGEDFVARKRDLFTGRVYKTKHIEVKTGNARLSKLQRKKMKKGNYKVERTDPFYF